MAYETKELKKRALKAIVNDNCVFIEDVCVFMGIDKTTFYAHKLHESNDIKSAILKNKITVKSELRRQWYESDNATLKLALYKLIGTQEEAHRLNGSKQEIKTEIVDHTRILEELEEGE